MILRRSILAGLGSLLVGALGLGGYALAVEPFRLVITRYPLMLPGWPKSLRLRLAVIADLHACEPWMTAGHIRDIVAKTNALDADAILLLGDYVEAHAWISKRISPDTWAAALGALRAPLGVHAVLGNHDWWDDADAQVRGYGPTASHTALEAAGINVLENAAVRLSKDGQPFWLAGLGDQYALLKRRAGRLHGRGVHDLPGTLAKLADSAPAILMAHEPDIFPKVPDRIALTISGHTHGGQVRLLGRVPFTPYGRREPYAYGHFVEPIADSPGRQRHLIVSGGLGCSMYPVRFGVPPEIVLLDLGGDGTA